MSFAGNKISRDNKDNMERRRSAPWIGTRLDEISSAGNNAYNNQTEGTMELTRISGKSAFAKNIIENFGGHINEAYRIMLAYGLY